jgi:glucokinase
VSHVLAGDIGGTNARFALFDLAGKRRLVHESLASRSFASFGAALARFLQGPAAAFLEGRRPIAAATFGIAGPVVDERVKATNLPWTVDARAIARRFDIPRVTLLNDLVALGVGALASPPGKLAVLHHARPKRTGANVAVIAAGTGLGEATFVWDGERHVACPTEGGHTDFAPRGPVQTELLTLLAQKHGRVSYERVVAGSTIGTLYDFVVGPQRVRESDRNAERIAHAPDRNVAIVDLAESGESEAAMRTVDLWCSIYGAEAGNLALKSLATGGIYLAGGLSARLAPILARGLPMRKETTSPFLAAFLDKGRMRPVLAKIPVAVALDPSAGLLGAAAHAARSAASASRRS